MHNFNQFNLIKKGKKQKKNYNIAFMWYKTKISVFNFSVIYFLLILLGRYDVERFLFYDGNGWHVEFSVEKRWWMEESKIWLLQIGQPKQNCLYIFRFNQYWFHGNQGVLIIGLNEESVSTQWVKNRMGRKNQGQFILIFMMSVQVHLPYIHSAKLFGFWIFSAFWNSTLTFKKISIFIHSVSWDSL